MSINVRRTEPEIIYVNDKVVRLNMNGDWICLQELTQSEINALHQFLNSEKLDFKNRLN